MKRIERNKEKTKFKKEKKEDEKEILPFVNGEKKHNIL